MISVVNASRRAARVFLVAALAACGAPEPSPEPWSDAWLAREAERYLGPTANRRAALEASLVNPTNVYSSQRLASYGKDAVGWDALPVWNPSSRPVDRAVADGLARGEWPALPTDRLWDERRPTSQAAWIELGRRVFFEFPLRPEFAVEHALVPAAPGGALPADAAATAAALGVERTADGALPGLVVFHDVDGRDRVGITCAVCHAAVKDGAVVVGAARRSLDLGALRLAYYRDTGAAVDPDLARRMATWGPGRADVTEDDDEDPVAIPDLWGLRTQAFLTQAGTIRHVGPAALAIRQETQLLHASQLRVRPPRELAWALAMFLYSIEPPPARPVADSAAVARGEALFAAHCASCHASAVYGGDAIPAAKVGTDPALADGKARGTGRYRIAPLVRVADAAPYFHDGSVPTLELVLSRERLEPTFTGGARGPGPIAGHLFGTDLAAADRAAVVRYLESL
jgi:mono/diheme cytochrome c family protein